MSKSEQQDLAELTPQDIEQELQRAVRHIRALDDEKAAAAAGQSIEWKRLEQLSLEKHAIQVGLKMADMESTERARYIWTLRLTLRACGLDMEQLDLIGQEAPTDE